MKIWSMNYWVTVIQNWTRNKINVCSQFWVYFYILNIRRQTFSHYWVYFYILTILCRQPENTWTIAQSYWHFSSKKLSCAVSGKLQLSPSQREEVCLSSFGADISYQSLSVASVSVVFAFTLLTTILGSALSHLMTGQAIKTQVLLLNMFQTFLVVSNGVTLCGRVRSFTINTYTILTYIPLLLGVWVCPGMKSSCHPCWVLVLPQRWNIWTGI